MSTDHESLRVAVVTESFLPSLNGVTTSVCQILDHLAGRGHHAVVVCPGPAAPRYRDFEVVAVPALSYRRFPVGLPTGAVHRTLARFAPDVTHVASPFVLGAAGLAASQRLGIPSVAVYQTDVAGYAQRYGVGVAAGGIWRWIRRMHAQADVTLVPSTAALRDLAAHGVPRLALWGRGVDVARFDPVRRATPAVRVLRERLAGGRGVLAGYVGRLAPEKRVGRLAVLAGLADVRVVVVGDGPARATVARALRPSGACLLGRLEGDALADAYAGLDVFVHTGTEETFGQTIQEAMASGLPVIAPAIGGPLDLVRHGITGLLYPAEDDAALRAAVARLAADPRLRARIGAAARAGVAERSWDSVVDQLIDRYRAVIAARRPAPQRRPA